MADGFAPDVIASAYDATRLKTEAAWQASPEAGADVPLPYHPTRLAYTLGSLFVPTPTLAEIVGRLEAIAARDPTVTLVPRSSLHFTFLALTPHAWDDRREMPSAETYVRVTERHFGQASSTPPFILRDLRLLPMGNALLLAGIPTRETFEARAALIADLVQDVEAEARLKARYGTMFPPLFWHTTLARSRTALCPPAVRQLYAEYRSWTCDRLQLDTPCLVAVNFDWSRRVDLMDAGSSA